MKNKLFLAAVLAVATGSGCQKGPQARVEFGSDPKAGCVTFVRERFKALDMQSGDPLYTEVSVLDMQLRRRNYELCLLHHEMTGNYPGLK